MYNVSVDPMQIALVVDDDQTKQALSKCMLGEGNISVRGENFNRMCT